MAGTSLPIANIARDVLTLAKDNITQRSADFICEKSKVHKLSMEDGGREKSVIGVCGD